MVYREAGERKAMMRRAKKYVPSFPGEKGVVSYLLIVIYTLLICLLCILYGDTLLPKSEGETRPAEPVPEQVETPDADEATAAFVDFQPVVDEWVASAGGEKGVIVYDLDFARVAGEYNADIEFRIASLYKLFVVYEGYRRVQDGTWNADSPAGGTGHTIRECLDLAIRESHSPCAETLWAMIGHSELDSIVSSEYNISIRGVGSLLATPRQIMKMMQLYDTHDFLIDEDLISGLKDSFLNQPATTYDWRQGLPSGFSSSVNVYNKVGWEWGNGKWNIYDDAAIVDFVEQKRRYIIVVMTSGVSNQMIAKLGKDIEATLLKSYQ